MTDSVRGGIVTLILLGAHVSAHGHGTEAINVFLDDSNKLYIGPSFQSGPLHLLVGTLITTDQPAIGVLSPGNRVPDGADLGLDVTGGLLYWDGDAVAATSAEVLLDAPVVDGFGRPNISPTDHYVITADSDFQTGLRWGVYDGRIPGWDSHGAFSLFPNTAAPGVYGFVTRISSLGLEPTEPFLIPLPYDPWGQFDDIAIAEGIAVLTEEAFGVGPVLQAGDGNQDFLFDQRDIIQVLRSGKFLTGESATWGDGDWNGAPGGQLGKPPVGDGLFDQRDVIAALQSGLYLTGPYAASQFEVTVVPEPNGLALLVSSLLLIGSRALTIRGFGQPSPFCAAPLLPKEGLGEVDATGKQHPMHQRPPKQTERC